jgi:hypothetical protein
MLSAYFDETGHSQDDRQHFNGMAGVLAPADHWEVFEERWKQTLEEFKIPFFHMKHFAHYKGSFNGWSEAKRQRLYGKLLRHMEAAYLLPLGVSIPMKDFRDFPGEQQKKFIDPYYLGFLSVITYSIAFMNNCGMSPEEKVSLVFSDQVEFKNRAHELYDEATQTLHDSVRMQNTTRAIRNRTRSPVFLNMREFVALQAADIVAYEVYKEHERRLGLRQSAKARHGYLQLIKMSNRLGYAEPFCTFYTRADLAGFVKEMEFEEHRKSYWEKKRMVKS